MNKAIKLGELHRFLLSRARSKKIFFKKGKDKGDQVESRNDTSTAENGTENLGESLLQIERAVKRGSKDVAYLKSYLNERGIMILENENKKELKKKVLKAIGNNVSVKSKQLNPQCVMNGRCLGFLMKNMKLVNCYRCKELVHSSAHCSVNKDPYCMVDDFYLCRKCDHNEKILKKQETGDIQFLRQQRKRKRNVSFRRGERYSRRIASVKLTS